ncbi:Pre-C2HC domain,Zinc finger, CCHC-type,Reverse transcriptase domain [Cinara cedri]|uniref:Pre-C2HC domain,Zinc finger, CCHC-type,Reverse transcriptase domain n=1 Tax=Cinara cedri TaxID=506608 RepID=A0A5E4N886_9HEMI|nr:Pre-C2HC domain,Zinc finger, CCHC-type,Reverse transcriptase domain [Cinara cedri]
MSQSSSKNIKSKLAATNIKDSVNIQTARLSNIQTANLNKVSTSVNTNRLDGNLVSTSMDSSSSANWSQVPISNSAKRNLSSSSSSDQNSPKIQQNNKKIFFTSNRFEVLSQDEPENTVLSDSTQLPLPESNPEGNINVGIKPALPPPVFVKGVISFPALYSELIEQIGVDNFSSQRRQTYTSCHSQSPPVHVQITYPLIKSELELRLFEVRQVTSVLHKTNKLPLFFVDLEPTIDSNDIYKLTSPIHTKIKVEEPYKSKTISQCINCQEYGHTKSYCGYPARCVRCGSNHSSSACPNPRDATPRCALCSDNHPSNYKGCSNYTILAPPGPTYWLISLRKKPDIIDIFESNIPYNLFCSTTNLLEPCSDHSAVLLTISVNPPIRPSLLKLFHHSTDRLKFHNLVDQNVKLQVSLKSPQEIDTVINNLTNIIQSAAWASGPTNTQFQNVAPSVPKHIRILISNKRRARALYQPTKRLLKYKPPLVPIKNPHGGFASTDAVKAQLFKDHLTEIFTPHPDIHIPLHTDTVKRFLDVPLPMFPAVKHFSPSDVKFTIQKYSLKKSPGFDLITADVARCLPKIAIVLLKIIFNACLRLSYFPTFWKFSITILVPKPNKPPELSSFFRPISLLPFFSKILERLILKRILPYISTSSVLPDTQFGFRSAHSTIHQLHRLVDAISFSLEKKSYCSCVFLDISEAFYRVWHDGLLYKIKPIFHPTYYLLIKSYLTDRYFQVRVGASFSGIGKINSGVPQGGILSPTLFNIYIADQPTSPHTTVAEFADDKAIISIHENPLIASQYLQIHLDLMSD